jgi:putative ABC transport system permease protein
MNEKPLPPRWADWFLTWYCNPELLEEIQGDAHELYYERVEREGRRKADFKYAWDVIRFCRMSNVRRTEEFNEPGLFGILWNLNLKIAIRNSTRNKTVFFVKLSALAICLAFTFLLTGFVINELTYDQQYKDYQQIYRVGVRAEMQGKLTSYAVSPLPLAPTLADEIPGVERASRFMFASLVYEISDQKFYNIVNYAVDSNFLRMFNQEYIEGSEMALDQPNRIVLTESTARRLFGDTHVAGKIITAGDFILEIGAVIKDRPLNTHFTYDVLVSWDTFHRNDVWDNINAYTYIKLASNIQLNDVDSLIAATENDYLSLMSEEYEFTAEPIFERIDKVHTNGYLDEDFAPKRSRNYVYIILSVIVLFLLTGLFNYLNLALAELTTQVKKIAILKTFGGIHADHRKIAIADAIVCLVIVAPVVVLIVVGILSFPGYLPAIEPSVWTSQLFIGLVTAVVVTILICSSLNSIVISRSEIMLSVKGNSASNQKGFTARKFLVAAQLSFAIIMIGLISVVVDQFNFINDADKGFDAQDVIVLLGTGPYDERQVLEESIRKMSGVKKVAGSSFYPDEGIEKKTIFAVETSDGMKNRLVNFIYGDKDYLEVLDIKVKAGRAFDDRATDQRSYIVNEAAVKEFGWSDPIGKSIGGPFDGKVIGVVEDFHFESMHTRLEPVIIFLNNVDWDAFYIYIKTEPLQSNSVMIAVEKAYHEMWPDVPFDYRHLNATYSGLYKQDYEIRDIFRSGLIISILVSALGIFSISALLLSLRTKEMGIRKVVGAVNSQLFMMHLKPFAIFFVIATAIGLPVIFYLGQRWLNNFAYHINIDARYFVIPAVITILIILGAAVYHAIKGSRVNPVDILKNE